MHKNYIYKIRGYTKFATKFSMFAQCFGVNFTAREKKYIRFMFQLMAAIDIFIDSETVFSKSKEERFTIIEQCARTGDWSLSPAGVAIRMRLLQNLGLVHDLSEINTLVLQILNEEIRMRNAETIEDFFVYRTNQNKLAAKIIFASLLKSNPTESLKKFSDHITLFAVIGGYIDTFFDMALDYKEKNIRIKPSLHFRIRLMKEIFANSKNCLHLFLKQPKIFFYLLGDVTSVATVWLLRTFRLT